MSSLQLSDLVRLGWQLPGGSDESARSRRTHALIWAATGNLKRLGKAALRTFESAGEGQCSNYIPSIAFAELGEARHRGAAAVSTSASLEEWARTALASGTYQEAR